MAENPTPSSPLSSRVFMIGGTIFFVVAFTMLSFAKNTFSDLLTARQNVTNDTLPTAVRGTGVSDPLVTVAPRQPEQKNTDPVLGPADAPVTIFSFEEFTCYHCGQMKPVYDAVRATFPNDVKIVWKGVPDLDNEDSVLAQESARCAQDQGAFWEYHDQLYEHQLVITRDVVTDIAVQLGLNLSIFNRCLDDRIHWDLVNDSDKEAGLLQLTGTPYIIVGDIEFAGTASETELKQAVDFILTNKQ